MKAAFAENDTADVVKNELYACESQLLVYQGRKEVGGMDAPELHTAEIGRSDLTRARNFSRSAAATTVASTRTGDWYLLTNSGEPCKVSNV